MLKTLRQEYSGLRARILRVAPTLSAQAACEAVAAELREPEDRDVEVRYDARGRRGARRFVELALPAPRVPRSCFRSGGVYWITGGMGGLGRLFAEHAAATRGVTLVLSARTAASAEDEAWLTRLRASGANLEHRRVDLTDAGALRACYEAIVSRHGHLDGIIHAAGVLRDGYVESKTADAVRDVFAAKAAALVELDAITADAPLDFFVLFASIAGIWGNAGQADYAGANALLDAFAIERNRLVAEGRRAGRTLSIDWPLWRTGGMNVDAASERRTRRAYGLAMLERQAGMLGFERAMAAPHDHVVVLCGDAERIRGWVAGPAQAKPVAGAAPAAAGVPAPAPIADAAELGARVDAALARAVCEILRIGESDVDAETDFSAYGFDSISLTEFSNRIGERLGVELLPTIFYEYPSLLALRGFLLAEHGAALAAALQVQPAARRQVEPDPEPHRESNRESNPGAAAVGLPEGVAAAVATPGPARALGVDIGTAGARRDAGRRGRDRRLQRALSARSLARRVLDQPARAARLYRRDPGRALGLAGDPRRPARAGQSHHDPLGRFHRRDRRVRFAILRHLAEGGRADGSAAAIADGARLGRHGGCRLFGEVDRRQPHRGVPRDRPGRLPPERLAADRELQRDRGGAVDGAEPHLVPAEPARPERAGRDRLLELAGGGASRHAGDRGGRLRAGLRRRGQHHRLAGAAYLFFQGRAC